MTSRFTIAFFDWGGVIASDPGDDFLTNLLVKIGATPEQVRGIYSTYMHRFMRGQITEADYWRELGAKYRLSIPDSISDEFLTWQGLAANPDVLSIVDEIKAQGLKVALLTNMVEPTYRGVESAGYFGHFDQVIASCKVGYAKPDKEMYELALKEFQVRATESVFIDDKPQNLEPAQQLGFTTLLAKNPEQIIRDMHNLIALSQG
jgi:putative hydrolase of the HAD superfamily